MAVPLSLPLRRRNPTMTRAHAFRPVTPVQFGPGNRRSPPDFCGSISRTVTGGGDVAGDASLPVGACASRPNTVVLRNRQTHVSRETGVLTSMRSRHARPPRPTLHSPPGARAAALARVWPVSSELDRLGSRHVRPPKNMDGSRCDGPPRRLREPWDEKVERVDTSSNHIVRTPSSPSGNLRRRQTSARGQAPWNLAQRSGPVRGRSGNLPPGGSER